MNKKDLNFDLKQLRSFLETLQENSFTKASRKLHIGQATISHHIQQLEEMLGVSLIQRSSKSFSITQEGEVLQQFCNRLFSDVDTLKTQLSEGVFGGTIKIAVSTIPSTYILPSVIAEIRREQPQYLYRMMISDSREAIELLKEGAVDIAITGKQFRNPTLKYEDLIQDELILIAPPAFNKTVTLKNIASMPLVSREKGSGTRNSYEEYLNEEGIHPSDLNIVYECSTSEAVKEAVAAGIGISFISRLAVEKDADAERIKILPLKGSKIVRNMYCAYGKNRPLSQPAKLLLKKLKAL